MPGSEDFQKNIKLVIQYNGQRYCGWQIQPRELTIQRTIENAVELICKKRCSVMGSGRTDSGVHARGQVANVVIPLNLKARIFKKAMNANLPADIRVIGAREVAMNFHARKSAVEKTYRYLLQSSELRSPFVPFYVHWTGYDLNVEAMSEASRHLLGRHDFRSFMAAGSSVKSTTREVRELSVKRGGGRISISITANGFLRQMVRVIAGTLMEVGRNRIQAEEVRDILDKRDRSFAGPTASAEGLTLIQVKY